MVALHPGTEGVENFIPSRYALGRLWNANSAKITKNAKIYIRFIRSIRAVRVESSGACFLVVRDEFVGMRRAARSI
jgi:hypothetical protein